MSGSYLNSSYGPGSPCPFWGLDFQLFPDDAVEDTNAFDAFSPTADNQLSNTLWPGSSGTLGSNSFSSLNPSDNSPATSKCHRAWLFAQLTKRLRFVESYIRDFVSIHLFAFQQGSVFA